MSTSRAMKQLKSVWGKAGLDRIPSIEETKGTMQETARSESRAQKKSARTARLDLRLTADEKKRTELWQCAKAFRSMKSSRACSHSTSASTAAWS